MIFQASVAGRALTSIAILSVILTPAPVLAKQAAPGEVAEIARCIRVAARGVPGLKRRFGACGHRRLAGWARRSRIPTAPTISGRFRSTVAGCRKCPDCSNDPRSRSVIGCATIPVLMSRRHAGYSCPGWKRPETIGKRLASIIAQPRRSRSPMRRRSQATCVGGLARTCLRQAAGTW